MAYTKEELDKLVCKFERCAERHVNNKDSPVKLRAAERDLLAVAEAFRDLGIKACRGNKDLLADVFGGQCEHIGRMYIVCDAVELSDMHAGDQRWEGCRRQLDIIKQILLDLGSFKPWTVGKNQLESLEYPGVPSRLSPGERVDVAPIITGAAPTYFKVQPLLPEGLRVNPSTGVIAGVLKPDLEVAERTYVVTGGRDGAEASFHLTFCVRMPPPSAPMYPAGLDALFMAELVHLEPTVEGSIVTCWRVEPALPEGLRLDAMSGVITGVPRVVVPPADYTITAANRGGDTSITLRLGVKVAPPCMLAYSNAQEEYPQGVVIYLVPEIEFEKSAVSVGQSAALFRPPRRQSRCGTASNVMDVGRRSSVFHAGVASGVRFTVEPPLPEGLELTSMGVITGRAVHHTDPVTYTITAKNDGGMVMTKLPLAIQLAPPSRLCYPDVCAQYCEGEPMSCNPMVDGLVTKWSLASALPAGLALDESTGAISGIPSEVAQCSVTVTATNAAGSTDMTLTFSVLCAPPRGLQYPSLQAVYPCFRAVVVCPTVIGTVDEYSLGTPLPPGLALDPATGVIKGSPTQVAAQATYEILAKNKSGTASASLTFSVRVVAPEALEYPSVDDLYFVDEEIDLQPSIEGCATIWSVAPGLPQGLVLDEASGRISGSPCETADEESYTVTASNEAGGTSAVLVFMITAPVPDGLSYPVGTGDYSTKSTVLLEPELECGVCGTYTVQPALPEGLQLDPKTGTISGNPTAACEPATYTVTVANIAGECSTEITIGVSDIPDVTDATETFASMIEQVTDLATLRKMDPSKKRAAGDWMLWMVHRAWLNDPELVIFDFDNLHMPLPHQEPRIAPKLMKALAHNTCITQLHLNNSNLQKPQGHMLAQSLKENKTLQILGIETNNLDSATILDIAEALKDAPNSGLQQLRVACQKPVVGSFGRPVEQALAEMMEKNKKILKLGVALHDAHWNTVINQYVMRNNDIFRRQRKGRRTTVRTLVPAVQKVVSKICLEEPPERPAWEVFDAESKHISVIRNGVAASKRVPTREQVQAMARSAGVPLKFAEVAPLLRDFRKRLLDSAIETRVMTLDQYHTEHPGVLVSWSEANDKWSFDVWPSPTSRLNLTADKQPAIELSEAVAQWLAVE